MFRAIPVFNKLCIKKNNERKRDMHMKNLQEMRHFIDNTEPATMLCVPNKRKQEQLKEVRFSEIERENKILLDKITGIMRKAPQRKNKKLAIFQKPKKPKTFSVTIEPRSLNKDARKRDLLRIAMENHEILKRISMKKSSYDLKVWERDRKEAEKYMAIMCEYPPVNLSQTRSKFKHSHSDEFMETSASKSNKFNNNKKQMASTTTTGFGIKKAKPKNIAPLKNDSLKQRKIVIYKKPRKIGLNLYIVEISFENDVLRIVAEDVEKPEVKFLELEESEGMNLLRDRCKNIPENLVALIRLENDIMFIKNTEHEFINLINNNRSSFLMSKDNTIEEKGEESRESYLSSDKKNMKQQYDDEQNGEDENEGEFKNISDADGEDDGDVENISVSKIDDENFPNPKEEVHEKEIVKLEESGEQKNGKADLVSENEVISDKELEKPQVLQEIGGEPENDGDI